MQSWVRLTAIFAGLGVVGWVAYSYFNPPPESNPIVAEEGANGVVVLPWQTVGNYEEPNLGWVHRQFWMVQPMRLSHGERLGKQALKCETNSTASILTRTTDIEVGDYPLLVWDWLIDYPISSALDEATEEGDDHPARLILKMEDREGGEYTFEIIWSNQKYEPGDYKYIGDFAHYVANGLDENAGVWQHQEVNLMEVYRDIYGRDDFPILKSIGIFCDSDNTGSRSIAYFSDVEMQAR
ncbi:MAG: DUF3047 domain-containing protein [Rhodobacteraceae bacterium]|nr:DUF3047 domain-containing protein [Paracoccaceae bacterium]